MDPLEGVVSFSVKDVFKKLCLYLRAVIHLVGSKGQAMVLTVHNSGLQDEKPIVVLLDRQNSPKVRDFSSVMESSSYNMIVPLQNGYTRLYPSSSVLTRSLVSQANV